MTDIKDYTDYDISKKAMAVGEISMLIALAVFVIIVFFVIDWSNADSAAFWGTLIGGGIGTTLLTLFISIAVTSKVLYTMRENKIKKLAELSKKEESAKSTFI